MKKRAAGPETSSGVTNPLPSGLTYPNPTFTGTITISAASAGFADGTAAAPSIPFASDADGTGTGFYRSGANIIGVANNGANTWTISAGSITSQANGGFAAGGAGSTMSVAGSGAFVNSAGSGCLGELRTQTELLTLSTSGTTTDTTANLLPVGAIIVAVMARVTTTIATATDWKLGDPTIAGRFTAANATMTAGTTDIGTLQWDGTGTSGNRQVAAAKVRVTTTGTPSAGVVRITTYYFLLTPPTA